MKLFQLPGLLVILIGGALFLLACSGATPTPVPPTVAPTSVPPTIAPTVAPTRAPTAAPTAASSTASGAAQGAFKKFDAAENFRLKANVNASPEFFQAPFQPGPTDDPNMVEIVTLDGENHASDIHYTLGGFLGSFVGVLMGFAETNPTLELISIDDKVYMRGVLEGESEAKWYLLPDSESSSMSFKPQDIVRTVTGTDFAQASFAKSGSATIGNQTCDVYSGDRAAFDAVLPKLEQEAGLNADEIDATKLTKFEFQVTVCPDGNVYDIVYNFEGPVKSKPATTGKFGYHAQLSGFAETISIQAPADAVPMPETANPVPTEEPIAEATSTRPASGAFTSLDGEWEGTSSTDSPILFTVEDGKITYVNLNYYISKDGCSASGAYGTTPDDGVVQDDKFTVILTNSDGVRFLFAGIFDSKNQASGTLNITGKTYCGDADEEFTWTASHVSAPDSGDETPTAEATIEIPEVPTLPALPEPTVEIPAVPQPTSQAQTSPTGSAAIVTSVFEALNQGDVNAALALFDEDVIYTLSSVNGIGVNGLKNYMFTAAAAGAKYSISNLQDLDSIVTFTLTISGAGAGTFPNSSAIVEDGKITILTIK
jgi:hypothetical protein